MIDGLPGPETGAVISVATGILVTVLTYRRSREAAMTEHEAEHRALVDQWRDVVDQYKHIQRTLSSIPPALVDGQPAGTLRDHADREMAELDADVLRQREREIRAHLLGAHQRATRQRVTGDQGAGTFIPTDIADAIRHGDLQKHRRGTARDLATARAAERHQREQLTAVMDQLPGLYRTRAYRARAAAVSGVAAVVLAAVAFAYGALPATAAVLLAVLTLFLIGGAVAAREDIDRQIVAVHTHQDGIDQRETERIEAEVAHLAAGGNPDTDDDAQDDGRPAPRRRRLPRL